MLAAPPRRATRGFLVYDPDTTERELKELEPLFVVPARSGVPLADAMSEASACAPTVPRCRGRRNKISGVTRYGPPGCGRADNWSTTDADAGRRVGHRADLLAVCVEKPLASASTDGVFICRDAADLRAAFPRRILSRRTSSTETTNAFWCRAS